jgi:hypothetical protein
MPAKRVKQKAGETSSASTGSTSALSQRPEFNTVCWQPRTQPVLFFGVLSAYTVAVFMVYWFSSDWAMTAISVCSFLLVSWRLWMPVKFHIGPTGIIQSVLGQQRQLGWGYVQQIQTQRGGVRIHYQTAEPQFGLSRTIVISVPFSHQDALVSTIEYYLIEK